jgi:heterodisulfide reductase subunit A
MKQNSKKIGVFICHCGINIAGTINVKELCRLINEYPGVTFATEYVYMCSDPGQAIIKEAISEHKLEGVVVAACSPTLHESTFRELVQEMKLNEYQCEIANIREQCSWVHIDKIKATDKALRIIKAEIEKVRYNEPLKPIEVDLKRRALVIGGGISGIQSALDIANGGYEVFLVEKEPSIGGHMIQLSETFPTLDCSQCIMTPKMVEVSKHPNIKLLTYAEVQEIKGYVGNYKVKIKKKPTFVNWEKCNGCGECINECPIKLPHEFDADLSNRTAIYRPFPQAVPNKFTIDKRGIPPCRSSCPAGVNVPGYIGLIKKGKFKEALTMVREENPLPGICGRVCPHPCETECLRSNFDEPVAIDYLKRFIADYELKTSASLPEEIKKTKEDKVAIIGSGPSGLSAGYYLAKMGYPVTIFESLSQPGGMMVVGIPPNRLPREIIKREIDYIQSLGVEIRTKVKVGRDITIKELQAQGYKAFFLAIGAHKGLKLNIPGEDEFEGFIDAIDFLRGVNLEGKRTIGKKVLVIGGGNSAIDAARTALRLGSKDVNIVYRRSRLEMPANPWEIEEAEAEGIKIHYLSQPIKILGKDGKVQGMECLRCELGEPDASGRRRPIPIQGSNFTIDAEVIIPAISQKPDLSFLEKDHGFEISKWDTFVVDPVTLATNIPGIFAGGDAVSGPSTVIEAIEAGKQAAISIDRFLQGLDLRKGREKVLKEVKEPPTRRVKYLERSKMPKLSLEQRRLNFNEVELGLSEEQVQKEAERCLGCGGCTECLECEKACEPEAIQHQMTEEYMDIEVGSIVVATGYDLYPKEKLAEYGYGKYEDVIDGLAFERLLSASGPTNGEVKRPSDGKTPKEVVFIQCVGSREPESILPYCSKICCMYTAKHAKLYKHRVPDGQAYVFYMDIRAGGKGYEEFVQEAIAEERIMYIRGRVAKVFKEDGKIVVWGEDTLIGRKVEIRADLVVLATAIMPSKGVSELIKKLKVQTDEHLFLKEAHPKLRPVETLSPGIYLAGCAQAPKDIPEAVGQAGCAASKVLGLFSSEKLLHEPIIVGVNEDLCSGCSICVPICPYDARELVVEEKKVKVNEVLCEGCGSCAAACPSGAAQQKNLFDRQIHHIIQALMR